MHNGGGLTELRPEIRLVWVASVDADKHPWSFTPPLPRREDAWRVLRADKKSLLDYAPRDSREHTPEYRRTDCPRSRGENRPSPLRGSIN